MSNGVNIGGGPGGAGATSPGPDGPENLTGRAAVLSAGGFVSYAVYVVVPVLLARLLSRAEYGVYGQVLLVAHIAYHIGIFGFPASVTYLFPRMSRERRAGFLRGTAAVFLGAGVLTGAAIALLAGPVSAAAGHPDLAPLLRVGALYVLFLVASDFLTPVLVVTDHALGAALCQVGETLGRIGCVLGPILLGFGVRGVFLALAGLLALKLLGSWLFLGAGYPGGRLRRATLVGQARYALPLGAAAGLATLAQYGIEIVALVTFSAPVFAIFAIGKFRLPVATLLKRAAKPVLRDAFSRHAARGDLRGILLTYREATRKTALLVFPVAVFTAVHAESVVTVLFSAKYLASTPLFRLGAVVVGMGALYLSVVAEGMGRSGFTLRLAALHLLTSVPVAIAGTLLFGIIGPVLGEVAGTGAASIYGVILTRRLLRVRLREVLPFADLALILGVSGAAAVAALPAHLAGLAPLPGLLLAGAFFTLLYTAGLLLPQGPLKAHDRAFLLGLARRSPAAAGGGR